MRLKKIIFEISLGLAVLFAIPSFVFAEYVISQGGTAATSFSPNSIIVSGPTTLSSLTGSSSPTVDYIVSTTTHPNLFGGELSLQSNLFGSTTISNCNGGLCLDPYQNNGVNAEGGLFTIDTGGNVTAQSYTGGGSGITGIFINSQTGYPLTVDHGGTNSTSFGQGWIFSNGGTGALAASTSPTVNYLTATSTTATSTFAAGVQATALNITSITASSTFANGLTLSRGCFAINNVCIGTNAGTVTSVSGSGGSTGLTLSGGPITTSGTLTLGGTLVVANGGTGHTTFPLNTLLYYDGTNISATSSQALYVGNLIATTTATSTFGGAITVAAGQGTSTFAGGVSGVNFNFTGASATNTASNGINISAGCYAIGNTCLNVGVSSVSNSDNTLTISPTTGAVVASLNLAKGNTWTGQQIFTGGPTGVGTSTPFSMLSVSTSTASAPTTSLFAVASSTNATLFNVLGNGFSGHGSSSPQAILSVSNTAGNPAFMIGSSTQTSFLVDRLGNIGIGTTSPSANLAINPLAGVASNQFLIGSTTGGTSFIVNNSGQVGIGTTSPLSYLSVTAPSSAPTTSLFTVASSTNISLLNVLGNGNVGIGTTSPLATFNVVNGGITQNYASTTSFGGTTLSTAGMTVAGSVSDATNLHGPDGVYISGKYAYVANFSGNMLTIVDVSVPTAPVVIGKIADAVSLNQAIKVYVSGRYAYVAADAGKMLTIVDVSNPKAPIIVGKVFDATNLNGVNSIFVSGKYAYMLAAAANMLTIIDVSNPMSPVVIGKFTDATNLSATLAMYVSGRYVYIVNQANGNNLAIVDVSNPYSPILAGKIQDNTNLFDADGIYVSGRYAYITCETVGSSGSLLTIVDVSNPASPTVTGHVQSGANLNNANFVFVSGKYAYVSANAGSNIATIDVSNPAKPVIVGVLKDTNNLGGPEYIVVAGKYAYISAFNNNALSIVDLTGIDSPVASIGNVFSNNISVSENLDVAGIGNFHTGLNVGQVGILSDGPGRFNFYATTSLASSLNTGASTTDQLGALSADLIDNNTASIVNALSLFHTTASTTNNIAANNIGTGLLFGTQDASGNATSTSRISSILTNVATATPTSVLTFANKNTAGVLTEFMRLDQNGNLGLGTTSPVATLSVNTNSSSATPFKISTTTGATLFTIDNVGNHLSSGDTPTVSCSPSGGTVAGNNTEGQITTGTLSTACTLTFADGGYPSGGTMSCNVNDNSTGVSFDVSTLSNTAVTFSSAGTLTSGILFYHCGESMPR